MTADLLVVTVQKIVCKLYDPGNVVACSFNSDMIKPEFAT